MNLIEQMLSNVFKIYFKLLMVRKEMKKNKTSPNLGSRILIEQKILPEIQMIKRDIERIIIEKNE